MDKAKKDNIDISELNKFKLLLSFTSMLPEEEFTYITKNFGDDEREIILELRRRES